MQRIVTAHIADQIIGFPVENVKDVLGARPIRRMPNSPPGIAGCFNLRGTVSELYDTAYILGLRDYLSDECRNIFVFEGVSAIAGLMVDKPGEILEGSLISSMEFSRGLNHSYRACLLGVIKRPDTLISVISPNIVMEQKRHSEDHYKSISNQSVIQKKTQHELMLAERNCH